MNRRKFFAALAATTVVAGIPVAAEVVKPKDEWVSVKTRLPEEGQTVWAYDPNTGCVHKTVFTMHLGRTPFHGRCWFACDNHKALTTHWRSTPLTIE